MSIIRRALRGQVLTLVTCLFVGACAAKIPVPAVGFSGADLAKQNKAFVAFAAQITGIGQTGNCRSMTAYFEPIKGSAASGDPIFARGGVFEYDEKHLALIGRELAPGAYGISRLDCYNSYVNNSMVIYMAGAASQFAAFTVASGEVVDLGMITLDVLLPKQELLDFTSNKGMSAMVFVDPVPQGFYQKLAREDIPGQLVTRLMLPAKIVTPGEMAERCTAQKAAKTKPIIDLGTGSPPPVCNRLAGGITISDKKLLESGASR